MTIEDIVTLPSGTELSIEAAIGDIRRVIHILYGIEADAEASDLEHVEELLELLASP